MPTQTLVPTKEYKKYIKWYEKNKNKLNYDVNLQRSFDIPKFGDLFEWKTVRGTDHIPSVEECNYDKSLKLQPFWSKRPENQVILSIRAAIEDHKTRHLIAEYGM